MVKKIRDFEFRIQNSFLDSQLMTHRDYTLNSLRSTNNLKELAYEELFDERRFLGSEKN